MHQHNPEIENHLDALAEICCDSLSGEKGVDDDRVKRVIESLVMSGYGRDHSEISLQSEIESRVKDQCRDGAMHRGGALSAITKKMSEQLRETIRWQTRQPEDDAPPKAANISSATDA